MKESRELVPQPKSDFFEFDRPFEPQIVAQTGRYPAYRETYAQEGIQILDYWRAIRKRIWLVVGIAVLVTTLAAIYMARKPNVFSARATIQVDMEQTNPDLVTDRQRPLLTADPSYFNTQLQLLNSDALLRRVVKEHRLDSNPEFQRLKSEGMTSPWRAMLKAVGLARDEVKQDPRRVDAAPGGTNSTLVSADEIAEAVRLAPYVDIIKKNLSSDPVRESRVTVKDTRLIDISFTSQDPELAAFVANGICETFTNYNQERRTGTSRKTSDFLQGRIADLQSEIRADELKLHELRKTYGIINITGEQTIEIERLAGLNREKLAAELLRTNAEAELFSVKNSPDRLKSMVEASLGRFITEKENSRVNVRNETEKRIADLQSQKAKLLETFHENTEPVKEVDKQIQSLKTSLDDLLTKTNDEINEYRNRASKDVLNNLQTTFTKALDNESKIRAAYDAQYAKTQSQNSGAVTIKLLEQNLNANKAFLKELLEKQSGNDIAARGSDNNISVAGFAIPDNTPVAPRRMMTVLAALLLSTLFGMGLAVFLEYLDDTIRTVEEIENYLQLPALAAIPTIESMPKRKLLLVGSNEEGEERPNSELLIYSDSRSGLSEAYRQLRTSILLSTAGHPPKSLLVTSSLPSEGKTTTATNTAISLAQTGANVLIIDADMRRPRLHSVFNLPNGEGLSTLLSSESTDADITRVVQTDDGTKMHLLTSGPIPPNPAELIGSEQMANLLKRLQKHYTHVVIDSPPITSFTDGVLIASMVDGVILVVHSGKSSRQVVRRARVLLQDVGARILGVVLNNVNLRSQDNYYYYQTYYHRNAYNSDEPV
ncbi:MAG TPA: polysaccharide biosynthesis tyrosine autokinase [Pyrinomonadaceae bacterium]|nr:polysaccharide biosynthesis tyrosine autokinase [Pyrinomonadaceae bacterium]